MNYLNEFDPVAAAWLRELRDAGLIPPCDIDTRSIEDVEPRELIGYTQCHFFAGIGGWPLALQLAGWPADRPIWTGSCPCQPFSAAGKSNGFADERHLWPAFHWLIEQCRPPIVVGEQVASAAVGPWVDLVLTDLEALGYASGAYAGPAAGVGAPHIRDRSYWVGHANDAGLEGFGRGHQAQGGRLGTIRPAAAASELVRVADGYELRQQSASVAWFHNDEHNVEPRGSAVGVVNTLCGGREERHRGHTADRRALSTVGATLGSNASGPEPTNGHWRDADWLGCRDGKWRPVEPGTFPLAHGLPGRVGRLRGYGNAIVPQQAAQFIEVLKEYQVCLSSPN